MRPGALRVHLQPQGMGDIRPCASRAFTGFLDQGSNVLRGKPFGELCVLGAATVTVKLDLWVWEAGASGFGGAA